MQFEVLNGCRTELRLTREETPRVFEVCARGFRNDIERFKERGMERACRTHQERLPLPPLPVSHPRLSPLTLPGNSQNGQFMCYKTGQIHVLLTQERGSMNSSAFYLMRTPLILFTYFCPTVHWILDFFLNKSFNRVTQPKLFLSAFRPIQVC